MVYLYFIYDQFREGIFKVFCTLKLNYCKLQIIDLAVKR